MNLFLRLLLVLVDNWRRGGPREDLFATTRRRFSVWLTDQDAFGHMTNSRYFSMTDLAIMDFMARTGAMGRLRGRGWFPVIAYEDFAFIRMLRFPQRFEIATRIVGWQDEHLCLTHEFRRLGRLTAEGLTLARIVDRKGKAIPFTEVTALFGVTHPSPPLPETAIRALDRLKEGAARRAAEARPDPTGGAARTPDTSRKRST